MNIIRQNQIVAPENNLKIKFLYVFEFFIKSAEEGKVLSRKGKVYEKGTIRGYKHTLRFLKEYEELSGRIFLEDITPYWAEMFIVHLTKYEIAKNTVYQHISRIKAVLNRANKAGITFRNGYGISNSMERPMTFFNTLEDLRKMKNLDLKKNVGMSRVRDIYIMNCFIGLRFTDLIIFLENPKKYMKYTNGKFYINIFSQKTNTESVIPISAEVREVLQNWNYDFGKLFSSQYFNYTIKEIARAAAVNEICVIKRTIGGKMTHIEKEKWEIMSSHTARRTFVSLCVLSDLNQQNIMKMTGHTSESSFQAYVRISNLQNAVKIANHPFFKIKL